MVNFALLLLNAVDSIDIKSLQNRLLKVCYVSATSADLNRLLFFSLRPLTVLIKQKRQAVHAKKQSIVLRCLWLTQTKQASDSGSKFIMGTFRHQLLICLFYLQSTHSLNKIQ
jgi:hypothetical protein